MPEMSDKPIPIAGEVGDISETDTARLSVVALRGNVVLATAQLRPDGSYRLNLPRAAAREESAFALQLAVLPSTAAAHPDRVADAPRVTVEPGALEGGHPVQAPRLDLSPALIDGWAIFWREWCVSGTVTGPDGCPAPAADVTVYTVSWSPAATREGPGHGHHRDRRHFHALLPLVVRAVPVLALRAVLVAVLALVVGMGHPARHRGARNPCRRGSRSVALFQPEATL